MTAGATVTRRDAPARPLAVAASATPRIKAAGVGKRYGDFAVFRDVDLEVGAREIVAVVGPSGCGKTTLLRCIDGLLPIDEGSILIEDAPVTGPRAGVAMVFQHFGLFPWKTVFHNVAYGVKLAGASKAEIDQKVPYFINLVGLNGFEHVYPYQMSGGMQQRCGLARALAVEPTVLLMDEPFAAVDAQTREILQFELLRIWDMRPTSMLFVTHSIDEAVLLSTKIVVMSARPGRIIDVIDSTLPAERSLETREMPAALELAQRVRQGLKAGHSYDGQ